MSFSSMLAHRCKLKAVVETSTDGSSVYNWQTVQVNNVDLILPCFLDLNFLRKGKDLMWVEAAGRPQDRTGVIFFKGKDDDYVSSGMRIEMVRGPEGMFSIEGALDQAWTPRRKHHIEFGVIEVATAITRGSG